VWTLLCNIPIARRRTMCFVIDDDEDLKWSGKNVGAALRWVHETGIDQIELRGPEDDQRFFVQFRPV